MEKKLKRASPPGDVLLGAGGASAAERLRQSTGDGAHSPGGEHIQEVD